MDPYHVLGVSRDASSEDIRKAYRALIKKNHPDINSSTDAIRTTAIINEAYDTLMDPEKRSAFDYRIFSVDLKDIEEDPIEVDQRNYKVRTAEQVLEKAKQKARREEKFYQVGRMLCYPIVLFSLVVIIDYYLPANVEVDTPVYGYSGVIASYIKTTQYEFRVPDHIHDAYDYAADKKKALYIEFTPIFETFMRVGVDEGEHAVMYDVPRSIYSFIFFPIPYILLALSIACIRNREYTRGRYVFCLMPTLIAMIFLVFMI